MFIYIRKNIIRNFKCFNNAYTLNFKRFCANIPQDNLNLFDEKVCELKDFRIFNIFYQDQKNLISTHLEKKLLFLDYFSTYLKNDEDLIKKEETKLLLTEIISGIKAENLKSIDTIYVLSLMESLYNLNYYPNISAEGSKLWITLEYLVTGTNFLKNIHLENYRIILKCFQKFFAFNETTISPEEIFEAVEYQVILQLRNFPKVNYDLLHNYVELFTLFGKNLEGSEELYNLCIDKIFTKEIIKILTTDLIINLYFASICIQMNVCSKNKKIVKFIEELEIFLSDKKTISKLTEESELILRWCFNKRNINLNKI